MAGVLNKISSKIRKAFYLEKLNESIDKLSQLQIDEYLQRQLYSNPKYQSNSYLNKFEYQSFSQFGEDGIIEEIFKRINTTNKYFVEFGVEDGLETNSTYLLHKNWKGLWIDGSIKNKIEIERSFSKLITNNILKFIQSFITAENIEDIFQKAEVPEEFDLLSIDIDRNDYHVWNAINKYKPRVIVIEYNAVYRPDTEFIVEYDANSMWDKTSNFGASLSSYCKLAEKKGYKLVGCSFSGVNAFFVQNELAEKYFYGPFTAENFYEPPRYFLYTKTGHPRKLSL